MQLLKVNDTLIKILLYTITFFSVATSETYQDRLRVYLDNSIKSFQINESEIYQTLKN